MPYQFKAFIKLATFFAVGPLLSDPVTPSISVSSKNRVCALFHMCRFLVLPRKSTKISTHRVTSFEIVVEKPFCLFFGFASKCTVSVPLPRSFVAMFSPDYS